MITRYFKWIVSILSILAVLSSIAVAWGSVTSELESLSVDYKEHKVLSCENTKQLQRDVVDSQIRQARVDEMLTNIQEDISEIKKDVKTIVGRR